MPQMKPLQWLMMLIYLVSIYVLSLILIYYFKFMILSSKVKKKIKKFNLKW
uniref:ATP synthase F0 subunit 8 n=1 Tax=Figites sp. ZJUH 20220010 TaxID=2995277 RepID=A0A9E8G7S9_9HYME|nr:ATP synthase F0 subunit 8 [Figites sp. ZJUH 20220010]